MVSIVLPWMWKLSADLLGIEARLFVSSHLSVGDGLINNGEFSGTCANKEHMLRKHMLGSPEVRGFLGAID